MRKGIIVSVKDRITDKDKALFRWNREIEFDLDQIIKINIGLFLYDDRERFTRTSVVEGIEEGMDGVKIYTENSVYDIKYLD